MHEKGRDWTRCRETGVWKDPLVKPALHEGGKQLLAPMLAQVTQLKPQLTLLEMEISTRDAELERLRPQKHNDDLEKSMAEHEAYMARLRQEGWYFAPKDI